MRESVSNSVDKVTLMVTPEPCVIKFVKALEAVKFMNHIFGFQIKDPKNEMVHQAKSLELIVKLSTPRKIFVPKDKKELRSSV